MNLSKFKRCNIVGFIRVYRAKYEKLTDGKQEVIDAQGAEIDELEAAIKAIQDKIEVKMNKERAIRKEIADSNKATEEEIRRIDAEIASINARKTDFIHKKEVKILEKETAEDQIRDLYHQAKCQMERADENVTLSNIVTLNFLQNQLMYFFPQKVNYMTENIQRKRDELELYKSIIGESLTFLRSKINENK